MIYIYGLCEPDLVIKYVGKATFPIQRLHMHVSEVVNKPCRSKKAIWIAHLLLNGNSLQMVILDIATDGDWQEKEVAWIKKYNALDLVNTAKGGASCERTLYHKRKTKSQPYVHNHAVGDIIQVATMSDMGVWLSLYGDKIRCNLEKHAAT